MPLQVQMNPHHYCANVLDDCKNRHFPVKLSIRFAHISIIFCADNFRRLLYGNYLKIRTFKGLKKLTFVNEAAIL